MSTLASNIAAPPRDPSMLRRLVFASIAGNALEWYDAFLYGFGAATIFGPLFFPNSDPMIGTLLAYAGLALGFAARPLGGIIFAHFGDRYGRKGVLIATLTLMGVSTFLLGCLPTYSSIGFMAPFLVVLLRVLQGIATGGEWGGAVLIVTENAPLNRQGFFSSWGQVGLSGGFLLAAIAFYLVQLLPQDQIMSWGWRLPFLCSVLIFGVGVFIRSRIPETAEFENVEKRHATQKMPLLEVIRRHPIELLTVMGLRVAENGGSYIYVVFSLTYAKFIGVPFNVMMLGIIISFALQLPMLALFGALSDRIGSKPLYLFGAIGMVVFAFPFFWLIDTKSTGLIYLDFVIVNILCFGTMNAVQPKLFSNFFAPEVRYSGLAIGHEVAAIFSGGLSPFIATWLLSTYKSAAPVAIYLAFLGGVTALTIIFGRRLRTPEAEAEARAVATVSA